MQVLTQTGRATCTIGRPLVHVQDTPSGPQNLVQNENWKGASRVRKRGQLKRRVGERKWKAEMAP
jgi:hypothetical protein